MRTVLHHVNRFLCVMLAFWCLPVLAGDMLKETQNEAQDETRQGKQWEMQTGTDGVAVWVKPEARFDRVRVETVVNLPLIPLLSLLQDAKQQHQWLPYTHSVSILDKPDARTTMVYFQTQSRWPFRPRDAVTRFVVEQPESDQVLIQMQNVPDSRPREKGFTRLEFSSGYWALTALPHCKTRVRYEAGSDWGGAVPRWVSDRANLDITLKALVNLRDYVEQKKTVEQPGVSNPDHRARYQYLHPPEQHKACGPVSQNEQTE